MVLSCAEKISDCNSKGEPYYVNWATWTSGQLKRILVEGAKLWKKRIGVVICK